MNRVTQLLAVVMCTLGIGTCAVAASWPERPIRLLVPSAAGGSGDTLARPLAHTLSGLAGQTVMVENRGGVGGVVGADVVAKGEPDGYLFLFGAVHHTIAPAVLSKIPYDTEKDLVPVAMIASMPNVMVTLENDKLRSVGDVIKAGKEPNRINYGTSGVGTMLHLIGGRFDTVTGTQMTAVHYKGSGPAMTALLGGGQIDIMFETMPSAFQQIKAGRLKPLAVTSAQRSPWLPDVPTLSEAGVPDLVVNTWYGIFAPAGTPPEITERMAKLLQQALATPELKEVWERNGASVGDVSPEAFPAFVKSELVRWDSIAKAAKLETY